MHKVPLKFLRYQELLIWNILISLLLLIWILNNKFQLFIAHFKNVFIEFIIYRGYKCSSEKLN